MPIDRLILQDTPLVTGPQKGETPVCCLGNSALHDTRMAHAKEIGRTAGYLICPLLCNVEFSGAVFRVRWNLVLGSDYVESDVFRHQVEIRVMVDELQTVFGTEGADEDVYRLPDGHAF